MTSLFLSISHILATDPSQVAAYLRSFGWKGPLVSCALMVVQSVIAPLPAFLITFANGMIWGFWGGALLSWSSAMLGALLCFLIARVFGRPLVAKLVGGDTTLQATDTFFQKYGSRAVLIARLLPFVSFDVVSYASGLTPITMREFIIATGLGQLPATLVYSYIASIGGAAGSVKMLLIVFSVFLALIIVGVSLKPWFIKRFGA